MSTSSSPSLGAAQDSATRGTTSADSTSEAAAETYTLHITRFTLIDTAEESAQWTARARAQWGGGAALAIRVMSCSTLRGQTEARRITFAPSKGWSGIEWDDEPGIAVPLREDAMMMLEVVALREGPPRNKTTTTSSSSSPLSSPSGAGRVIGLGMLSGQAMINEGRQLARLCVHILPAQTAIDVGTVYALVEAELHSSAYDEPPEKNYMPLEYNYGSVRVSCVDFYYPSFFLTGTGEYIVTNVLCAMNMTESSSLAMQLVPLHSATRFIVAEPEQIITVRAQQRAYFSATWVVSQKAFMHRMQLQLNVNGSQQASAPIIIQVHIATPQPTTTDIPYHYWVNTTRVTNRQLLCSQELPLIRAILPVYRFVGNAPVNQTEGIIVAFDKDKGKQVLVRANGDPVRLGCELTRHSSIVTGEATLPASATRRTNTGNGITNTTANGSSNSISDGTQVAAGQLGGRRPSSPDAILSNASFVVRDPRLTAAMAFAAGRGQLLNLYQKTCTCTITLGPIHGFPMVYESLTGISPSFQVSLTLLDQKGWQVVQGETMPSYQSASGSLRWAEKLVLRKWPGAESTQFVRLNLTEVRPRDDDETPIGAGLISLPSMHCITARNTLCVAFYIYETYSLYDQLASPSLLMQNVSVVFSDMR